LEAKQPGRGGDQPGSRNAKRAVGAIRPKKEGAKKTGQADKKGKAPFVGSMRPWGGVDRFKKRPKGGGVFVIQATPKKLQNIGGGVNGNWGCRKGINIGKGFGKERAKKVS